MNVWDILVYILLGLLGMTLLFMVMTILSFGYVRNDEYLIAREVG